MIQPDAHSQNAIPVLAGLVCASLTEDRYGVVQRDIPRILEAFLSFLTALEEYQVEVTKQYIPPTPDEVVQGEPKVLRAKECTRVEVAKASEAIGIVADGMFLCAIRIVHVTDAL